MVASEFIDYLNKLKGSQPRPEDFSDRLNFVWTPLLLLLCGLVVFGKQYVLKPIACFFSDSPTAMQGSFLVFAENYCWITGTYSYIEGTEQCPHGTLEACDKFWASRADSKLHYYQWVPFVLALQCVVTYVPKLFWRQVCCRWLGSDIYSLVELAAGAKTSDADSFKKTSERVADVVERMLIHSREYRNGILQRFRESMYRCCSLLVVSKRMGTLLTVLYIVVKVMCLTNAVGQLRFMELFLGYKGTQFTLGFSLLKQVFNNSMWQETEFFPLMTMCRVTVFELGSRHTHKGQCTLPVNMLNEKIYTFLYFWFVLAAFATVLSCLKWLYRLIASHSSVNFVKLCLRVGGKCCSYDKPQVQSFINKYLRRDGLFLVLILSEGADKVIATQIVRLLYQRWLRQQEEEEEPAIGNEKLPIFDLKDTLKQRKNRPTAPDDSGLCA